MTATARVVNPSDKPLHISRIVTSCGCTTTSKLSVVPAHGFAPFVITFDSANRRGTIDKQITIFTQEYPSEPLSVTLGGTVKGEWQILPSSALDFGDVPGGSTKTMTVNVSRISGGVVSLLPLSAESASSASASVAPIINPKNATIRISVTAPRSPGAKQETVLLSPKDTNLPPLRLEVSYNAVGQFRVEPDVINFGLVNKSGTTAEQNLTVSTVVVGNAVPALRFTSVPKGVAVRAEQSSNGQTLMHVALSLSALSSGSVLNERIVIATGSEKQPQIVVPVLAVASSKAAQ